MAVLDTQGYIHTVTDVAGETTTHERREQDPGSDGDEDSFRLTGREFGLSFD